MSLYRCVVTYIVCGQLRSKKKKEKKKKFRKSNIEESLKAKDPQSKRIIVSRSSNNLLEAWERRQSKQNVEPSGFGLVGVKLGAQDLMSPVRFSQTELDTQLQ